MERNKEALGRKIFCIAIPEKYSSKIVHLMVRNEYEVYSFTNSNYFTAVLQQFPRSVLLIYGREWEERIKQYREKIEEEDIHIIYLHSGEHGAAPPGHTAVDFSGGVPQAGELLINKLESLQVRGQRRYVRFGGTDNVNVTFSFTAEGTEYTGYVYDISSAGISCAFDRDEVLKLQLNSFIDRINLTLNGETYTITGKILLQRRLDEEKRLLVLMFDRRMPQTIREVLQDFIHSSLQAKMAFALS